MPCGSVYRQEARPETLSGSSRAGAVEAMIDPAVRARLAELGLEAFPRERQTPEVLGAVVKADAEKWWRIVKELGIKAQ
jgi:tripartite-type tricarboxylate transporter receptor subunit TctC